MNTTDELWLVMQAQLPAQTSNRGRSRQDDQTMRKRQLIHDAHEHTFRRISLHLHAEQAGNYTHFTNVLVGMG